MRIGDREGDDEAMTTMLTSTPPSLSRLKADVGGAATVWSKVLGLRSTAADGELGAMC